MPVELFGRYEIRQELGRGGMAHVYLAYDPTFRRQVAIKVLPPRYLENPLLRARFEREARLIATIEHPAIVPVYDFGEQDGQLYLVMRYMPGGSLVGLIRNGPLPLAKASELLTQLAPALDAVHAQGIVHRDLKPGNILFDAFGNPALSDFGIAHLSEATVDLTGEAIIGTPAYMSPEQVRSEVALDGRSDIYSLGIILYEMLIGRQPYQAATPMSLAMRHLTDPIPEICRLQPDLPVSLQALLERALAKDRELRYSRATDLAFDLRTLVDAMPSTALTEPSEATTSTTASSLPPHALAEMLIATDVTQVDSETKSHNNPDRGFVRQADVNRGTTAPPALKPALRVKQTFTHNANLGRLIGLSSLVLIPLVIIGLIMIFLVFRNLFPSGTMLLLQSGRAEEPRNSTPATILTAEATPVFFDDFSSPANGWPQGSTDTGGYTYLGDTYRISVVQEGALYWAAPDGQYSDLLLSVKAGRAAGDQGYYGALCRIQDAENYYYFILRPDGYYTIGRYEGGSFFALTPGGWTFNSAIQTGDAHNDLEAECVGDRLRLSVNGEVLAEVIDSAFSAGRSGLIAAALDTQGFQAVFDDFTIFSSLP